MSLDDYIPATVIKTLLILSVLLAASWLANHFLGDKYRQWRFGVEESLHETSINSITSSDFVPADIGQELYTEEQKVNDAKTLHSELDHSDLLQLQYTRQQWEEDRGYFDKNSYYEYETYDLKSLSQLSNHGDLKAMHLWANALIENGLEYEGKQVLISAAVNGSTKALVQLAAADQISSRDEKLSEFERTNKLKSMLVYSEVAAMRGDRFGIWASLMELNKSNLNLSDNFFSDVASDAEQLFLQLKKQRLNAGFDDFDNSSHPLRQAQMSHMISLLPNQNKWATSYITPEN